MSLPFRPTLWPSLIALPAIIVMIGLSLWQVQRLQWKNNLIAERNSRITAEAVTLPPRGVDLSDLEYRRVHVTGQLLHQNEFYLAARSLEGVPGYHIITPLQLGDGSFILFDRGYVSLEKKWPSSRPEGQIDGIKEWQGVLRLPKPKIWVQPENEPEKNVWFYIDPKAMASKFSLTNLRQDLYLEADASPNPGNWPRGGQTRIVLPNDHLQYAITWALLAIALAVIYVIYHLKREGKWQ